MTTRLRPVYAQSPTLAGIHASISTFYAGETKELREDPTRPGEFSVHSMATGRRLSPIVVSTPRGYFFGLPAH